MIVLSENYVKRLQTLAGLKIVQEGKKKDENVGKEAVQKDFVHLPELTMSKKVLIKYLDEVYGIKLKGKE